MFTKQYHCGHEISEDDRVTWEVIQLVDELCPKCKRLVRVLTVEVFKMFTEIAKGGSL